MLVDKPAGMTSHDVVHRVRRVLGIRTDTDDLTGRVMDTSDAAAHLSEEQVAAALAGFLGAQRQRPPHYSAKHIGGERSYAKARRGELVELPDVPVAVRRIEVVEFQAPLLTFRAEVSAGTYIRALARDLGERLGVGAHLTGLRREAIGSLRVEDSVPLDQLSPAAVISARTVLGDLPTVELDPTARRAVVHGRAVEDCGEAGKRVSGEVVGLLGDGELVAVAKAQDGWLQPTVVLATP